jgi:hypothetical protein
VDDGVPAGLGFAVAIEGVAHQANEGLFPRGDGPAQHE